MPINPSQLPSRETMTDQLQHSMMVVGYNTVGRHALMRNLSYLTAREMEPGATGASMRVKVQHPKEPRLAGMRNPYELTDATLTEYTPQYYDLKIFTDAFPRDRVIDHLTVGDAVGRSTFLSGQVELIVDGIARRFERTYVSGDTTVDERQFDGLEKTAAAMETYDMTGKALSAEEAQKVLAFMRKGYSGGLFRRQANTILTNSAGRQLLDSVSVMLNMFSNGPTEYLQDNESVFDRRRVIELDDAAFTVKSTGEDATFGMPFYFLTLGATKNEDCVIIPNTSELFIVPTFEAMNGSNVAEQVIDFVGCPYWAGPSGSVKSARIVIGD